MPTTQKLSLREPTSQKRRDLEHLATSIARELGVSKPTVDLCRRFNEHGLSSLEDQPRSGRPPTYTAEQRAQVIATALTDPKRLDLPFGRGRPCWVGAWLSCSASHFLSLLAPGYKPSQPDEGRNRHLIVPSSVRELARCTVQGPGHTTCDSKASNRWRPIHC